MRRNLIATFDQIRFIKRSQDFGLGLEKLREVALVA
jgi:hypothetical protein